MITKPQNGFLSVLGSFPVHFAMLLTMLGTVHVPRDGVFLLSHPLDLLHGRGVSRRGDVLLARGQALAAPGDGIAGSVQGIKGRSWSLLFNVF